MWYVYIFKIFLIIIGLFVLFQVLIRIFRKIFHFPAPAFIHHILDSNFRRKQYPPDKLIQQIGLKEGMHILDLGCGSGAYTTFVARAVSENGKVHALDIQLKMLKLLEKKLSKPENKDIKNIELIHGNAYELPFDNNSMDLVYMITVLQEIPDRNKALQETKRVLKPGGIFAVTEILPDPDYALKSTTIKICRKAGFILDDNFGNFWNYTVRFIKQSYFRTPDSFL